jgi:hypothetical protein
VGAEPGAFFKTTAAFVDHQTVAWANQLYAESKLKELGPEVYEIVRLEQPKTLVYVPACDNGNGPLLYIARVLYKNNWPYLERNWFDDQLVFWVLKVWLSVDFLWIG